MIKPGTIMEALEMGPHGKPVVAVIGYAGDWAAYEKSYDEQRTPEAIARSGDKIYEPHARALFPELKELRYRR